MREVSPSDFAILRSMLSVKRAGRARTIGNETALPDEA
jgi:hypothetical protein